MTISISSSSSGSSSAASQVPGFPVALESGRLGVVSASASSQLALVQNELLSLPVVFSKSTTITELGVRVWIAASAGGVMRLGIYASAASSSAPGALLAEATAVDAITATGYKKGTVSVAVTAGTLYHLAFVTQGAPATPPQFLLVAGAGLLAGTTATTAEAANQSQYFYSLTGQSGALPANWGALSQGTANLPPRMFVGS